MRCTGSLFGGCGSEGNIKWVFIFCVVDRLNHLYCTGVQLKIIRLFNTIICTRYTGFTSYLRVTFLGNLTNRNTVNNTLTERQIGI